MMITRTQRPRVKMNQEEKSRIVDALIAVPGEVFNAAVEADLANLNYYTNNRVVDGLRQIVDTTLDPISTRALDRIHEIDRYEDLKDATETVYRRARQAAEAILAESRDEIEAFEVLDAQIRGMQEGLRDARNLAVTLLSTKVHTEATVRARQRIEERNVARFESLRSAGVFPLQRNEIPDLTDARIRKANAFTVRDGRNLDVTLTIQRGEEKIEAKLLVVVHTVGGTDRHAERFAATGSTVREAVAAVTAVAREKGVVA